MLNSCTWWLMHDLIDDFEKNNIVSIDLEIPQIAIDALIQINAITQVQYSCIAGGFVRGLYMQQILGLMPQMNDIDVFLDMSVDKFLAARGELQKKFGKPIRFHIGQFEEEENQRGLIEFGLPEYLRDQCAGVESIQLNFGECHPWAKPGNYVNQANVGMNQIAINADKKIIASSLCISDLNNKTMTMNPNRVWTAHDWIRTVKSLERMMKERSEFAGWNIKHVAGPTPSFEGTFWDSQKTRAPRHVR